MVLISYLNLRLVWFLLVQAQVQLVLLLVVLQARHAGPYRHADLTLVRLTDFASSCEQSSS